MSGSTATSTSLRSRISKPLVALLSMAILFLAVSGYLSFTSNHRLLRALDEVLYHHGQKDVQIQLLARMNGVESAMFGFLLTGQEQFLGDYRARAAEIEQFTGRIRTLSESKPGLEGRAEKILGLVRQRTALCENRIEVRNRQGSEAAAALVATGEAKAVMDELLTAISDWVQEGERILTERRAKLAAAARRTLGFHLLFGTSSLGILIAICWMLLIENASRKQHEEALQTAKATLEERVRERTSALASANEALSERVTAHEQAERTLREREAELAAKNNELEMLVYIVSHDLRSPLVNIHGFTSELTRAFQEISKRLDKHCSKAGDVREPISDADEALSYISSAAQRMDTILGGILKYSRLGRQALRPSKIQMRPFLEELRTSLEFQLKTHQARIAIAPLPDCVGDEAQLTQLFANIFENALKYRHPGRPPEITVTGEARDGESIYHVTDNGLGIPENHREKVFQIFHRVGASAVSGEGLGLTICQRIVERNHGRIWLASPEEEGLTVSIALPSRRGA